MKTVVEELFKFSDKKYADFTAKLTPGIDRERFIGVKIPVLRQFAKKFIKTEDCEKFLSDLPHFYYEENILHLVLLSMEKDFDKALMEVQKFLPYIDNWAVCDTLKPAAFKRNKEGLVERVKIWIKSDETYTVRYAVGVLMNYFLDGDFKAEYLEIPAKIQTDDYYINMMTGWYYATALAKHYRETLPYITERRIPPVPYKYTLKKAMESFRVSDEQKAFLKKLR